MKRIGTAALWLITIASGSACSDETPRGEPANRSPEPGAGESSDGDGSVVLKPGADATELLGGQSGTDSPDDLTPPDCPPPAPIDPEAQWGGIRTGWLVATAMRRHVVEGLFLGEPVTLDVDLEQAGPGEHWSGLAHHADGTPAPTYDCELVDVPVRVSMHTVPHGSGRDTLAIEGRVSRLGLKFSPELSTPSEADFSGRGYLRVEVRDSDFSDPARLRAAISDNAAASGGTAALSQGEMVLDFEFSTEPLGLHDLTLKSVSPTWEPDGGLGPAWPETATLPAECTAAEPPTNEIIVATPEEALSRLVGTWAPCTGSSFSGVQIFPDRTWHAVLPGSEPRLGAGFEREGVVVFKDDNGDVAVPGMPQPLSLELAPLWPGSPGQLESLSGPLDISASGNTAAAGRLVRVDRVAAPAAPPLFAAGERAGLAGCSSTEAGIDTSIVGERELRDSLVGRWVGCSGFAGVVRFDSDGNLEILPSESYTGKTEPLVVMESSTSGSASLATPSQEWWVMRSLQPLKLWMWSPSSPTGPIVLSAEP